ncbi:ABC transporter ATP-binding protein [Paenibacillus taiwanensis]|uniref:ABC transporter ATP-binding protein n=1 Tax=Paenibacillus taiwanensis TaxID=401638 RepID=UPI00041453D7|nr:ATP-binding cassette domain-containing protein [Paenibacillus taiwanensis]
MEIIKINKLVKEYRTNKRYTGTFGALKTLFSKEYICNKAVDEISFVINEGDSIGYLGPNGAGKSTMIKMLTGILVPTSGDIQVNGMIPYKNRKEIAKKIGVVFGQRSQLWWDLPVIDSFELHKYIYKISEYDYRSKIEEFVELMDMKDFLNKPVRQLSLGQRMRAEIALALLHSPTILFLDEPTIGLDVLAKHNIRKFLRNINKQKNVAVFLTTHDLKDIEEICDRIIIVNQGKSVFDGHILQLKKDTGTMNKRVTIEFYTDPGQLQISNAKLISDEGVRKKYEFIHTDIQGAGVMKSIMGIKHQDKIKDISIEEMSIEEIIHKVFVNLNQNIEIRV